MKNSIAKQRLDLLKDWDYSKTMYDPYNVSIGSDKMLHWKCHVCGYEWSAQAKSRATKNTGCHLCKKRWNTSFNELTLSYYIKQVFGSAVAVNGYQLDIEGVKEVDIYIPNLSMVIEYDSLYYHENRVEVDKNKTKSIIEYGYKVVRFREQGLTEIDGAENIFYELDSNSHFKKQTIRSLLKYIFDNLAHSNNIYNKIESLEINADCDQLYILRQVAPVQQTPNLLEMNPEASSSWDYTKNNPFEPEHFKPNSNFKVWWVCSVNSSHNWRTQINVRNKGHGCPYCAGIKVVPERSLAYVKPSLAMEWDFSKNEVHPQEVAAHSNNRYWWICPDCLSSYDKIPNERMAGENCPYCAGKRVNHTNSLRVKYPELVKEWHPTLNGDLTPDDVPVGSHEKIWWKCERNHEWPSAVYSRTTGKRGCKMCYEQYGRTKPRIVRDKTKSLAYKEPELAAQWHPKRNDINPEKVPRSARYEYWWLCQKCGHEWQKAPNSRRSSRCPLCKR